MDKSNHYNNKDKNFYQCQQVPFSQTVILVILEHPILFGSLFSLVFILVIYLIYSWKKLLIEMNKLENEVKEKKD
ncbi:hypothetical protein DLAC_09364 [Tieghemostelium lacteum]|uniref:Uncharacterized protein n=1 Tax=Tieghemostelium lacteum TaxID=361077 RepID=A0A151Z9U0_TIELA|nr:hypothetical protein DLAC_09364 [Tieghemostelium lacteum]|eukprot:KYQ90727.1 hypothetical protein DLAC_09364 [Tieghemostelium lacteum]